MTDFAHLHVASGFSLRHGASTPQALVERAAAHGQPALALTDRDGLYGAVRFATAAIAAGVLPVLGVDLAVGPDPGQVRPAPRQRTPVRGGAIVDPRHPRVTVLARGRGSGIPAGAGWAALCRLVTDTHLAGERGTPVSSRALIARWATRSDGEPRLRVLLGPDSDVGRALLTRRPDRARAALAG